MNASRQLVKQALSPIPEEGLRRLIKHIDDGLPVLLNGHIEEYIDNEYTY